MIAKFLHVLGAVLLLGNVITTGLWSHWAMGSKERAVLVFATGAILKADLALTLGGGALLTIAGVHLVLAAGLPWDAPWLRAGLIALAASTFVWLAALLPLQVRMWRAARSNDARGLARAYRWWAVLGWADTALLLWGLWAMVSKGPF